MRGWNRAIGLALAIAGGWSAPAAATWLRASSPHFVIYADGSEASLRTMATQLEQLDGVFRYIYRMPATPDHGANRVTVYVAEDMAAIERLCGCRNVGGFYVPRASGSVAFTPRYSPGMRDSTDLQPQTVLFHEYAHHLLLGNTSAAYPAWFSEGYAEFISTVRFDDGNAVLGRAAMHRARSLLTTRGLTATQLFATGPRKLAIEDRESLYARGWLLTHYLLLDAKRGQQLEQYFRAFNAGTPSIEAAATAFGDLRELDKALDRYMRQPSFVLNIPITRLPAAAVDIRPVGEGERALMDLRMQSTRGVDRPRGQQVYARARPIAARFEKDAGAQGWFAEMAFDAGYDAEAEAAADRALAIDPKSTQALAYKGQVRLRRAAAARTTDPAVWKEARSWIVKANRLNPDEALPLTLYYESFAAAGERPTRSAVAGLHRAFELVPQDPSLRYAVARQDILDGEIDAARRTLRPLAYNPHASPDNVAARLIAILDSGKSGAEALAALDAALEAAAKAAPKAAD